MAKSRHFQPTAKRQLLQDVVDVALHRVDRDAEPLRDLLVAQALREEANDFTLPRGQPHRLQDLRRGYAVRVAGDLSEQRIRQRWWENLGTGGHGANGCKEILERRVLHDEA